MKSRITIEVNFDEGNLPVIQVLSQSSDDVRDKLIQSFLQSLQHTSRWCKILYKNEIESAGHIWHIIPIRPNEINQEMELMGAILRSSETTRPEIPKEFRPSNRLDLMSPSEKAITEAIMEIEKAGADVKLTNAQVLLGKARDLVYEYYKELA